MKSLISIKKLILVQIQLLLKMKMLIQHLDIIRDKIKLKIMHITQYNLKKFKNKHFKMQNINNLMKENIIMLILMFKINNKAIIWI